MPIEFHCSQCNQLLRVPDASAGKNARCPKCQTLMTVPAPALPNSFAPPGSFASPSATPPASAFSSSPPAKPAGAAPGNPFAGDALAKPGGNPFAGSINPYAAPAGGYEYQSFAAPDAPIVNVQVPFEPIWNHAWSVWQANLGILVGVTAIMFGISWAIAIPMAVVRVALEQNNNPELGAVVGSLTQIVSQVIQIYLGIGQAQISLKLARGQPAEVKDLFGGGNRFLPVLGAWLLAGIAMFLGLLLCIVPAILLALWFWPFYYLIVEEKTGVIESFSVASKITEGNRGIAFVLALVSFGVNVLGMLALCVGILFAAPLVSLLGATAYLMMSGQLPVQPQYAGQLPVQPQYAGKP